MVIPIFCVDGVYDVWPEVVGQDDIFVNDVDEHGQTGNIVYSPASEMDIAGNIEHCDCHGDEEGIAARGPAQHLVSQKRNPQSQEVRKRGKPYETNQADEKQKPVLFQIVTEINQIQLNIRHYKIECDP